MKIIFLEAYDGGSHRQFAKQLLDHLPFESTYYGLPPRHWRWRLQGSHYELSRWANENVHESRGVFVLSSLTDGAAFKGLLKKELQSFPIITYMHEYQGAYPIKKALGEENAELINREIVPATHLNQLLASDKTVFNSHFHRDLAIAEINKFLKRRGENDLQLEAADYEVIPVGLNPLPELGEIDRDIDLLWNHRMHFDKNPLGFLKFFLTLIKEKPDLKVALIGDDDLSPFSEMIEKYPQNIVAKGYVEKEEYWEILKRSKVQPITSYHDFQGLSLLEAMAMGVIPVAPERMVYPEHLADFDLLYQTDDELLRKCSHYLRQESPELRARLMKKTEEFHWENLLPQWLKLLKKISA